MQSCRFSVRAALIFLLLWGATSGAQTSQISPRIVGPVDELSLTTLRGNVSAAVQAQYDRGEAAGTTLLTHMRIVLARSAEQDRKSVV